MMRIQTFSDRVDGKNTVINIDKNGLDILSDDGKALYRLTYLDGRLQIMSGGFCEHENKQLDDIILVQPLASNKVAIERKLYINNTPTE